MLHGTIFPSALNEIFIVKCLFLFKKKLAFGCTGMRVPSKDNVHFLMSNRLRHFRVTKYSESLTEEQLFEV